MDEQALIAALDSGHIGGAYLDVFETEPLPPASELWDKENVFITPHASDGVTDWPARYSGFFGDNLERWLAGKPLQEHSDTRLNQLARAGGISSCCTRSSVTSNQGALLPT